MKNLEPIDKAFASTYKILLKRDPGGLESYEPWLSRHVRKNPSFVSPFGSKTHDDGLLAGFVYMPEKRVVTQTESIALENLHLNEDEITSLSKIKEGLDSIGFIIGNLEEHSTNSSDCAVAYHTNNIYDVTDGNFSEFCAFDGVMLNTKYLFGCDWIVDSQFSIKCYKSRDLNRCFELDNCTNCSDSYFSHNCEGLQGAMFCWNTKGKRYTIGNSQLQPDQYRVIKDSLVKQIADELDDKHELKLDIYNVGCYKK